MIPEAAHRSPGIFLKAEENPEKPQLGDRLMKGLCNQSQTSNGIPFLQTRSGRSQSRSGREKGGKGDRTGYGVCKKRVANGSTTDNVISITLR